MVLNAPHIHLMLNHVPIMGFAFGLLFAGWGWWRRNDAAVRAGLVLFLVTGLATIPVFLSGESAHEVVESLSGVSVDAIEVHEELGERAMIASIIVALFSAFVLYRYRSTPLPRGFALTSVVVGLVSFGLLSYAGLQGGMIHHEEIRPPGFEVLLNGQDSPRSSPAPT
jgi:uncharacterized membrane protein